MSCKKSGLVDKVLQPICVGILNGPETLQPIGHYFKALRQSVMLHKHFCFAELSIIFYRVFNLEKTIWQDSEVLCFGALGSLEQVQEQPTYASLMSADITTTYPKL